MVNVWYRKPESPSILSKLHKDEPDLYLPFKLILKKVEIAFLDGDVVHAGGFMPSGLICHGFLFNTEHEKNKQNTYHVPGNRKLDLMMDCLTPYCDFFNMKTISSARSMDSEL